MEIGSKQNPAELRKRNLNQLTPQEYEQAIDSMKDGGMWNPEWNNQQHTDQGVTFPKIASKYGNLQCANDKEPDMRIPAELFNVDLILNGRKFRVLCDDLLRIKNEELQARLQADDEKKKQKQEEERHFQELIY